VGLAFETFGDSLWQLDFTYSACAGGDVWSYGSDREDSVHSGAGKELMGGSRLGSG
jgi:hypothetical protein